MRKNTVVPLILAIVAIVGCDTGGEPTIPPSTVGGGWILETVIIRITNGVVTFLGVAPGVTVSGQWLNDLPGAAGNANPFTVTTNPLGLAALGSARAPATWKVTWIAGGDPLCAGHSGTNVVSVGALEEFQCFIEITTSVAFESPFAFSPQPLDASNPPATVTITGQGFSAQYGMPLIQYFDIYGNLVAQATAQSVAPDGTWIQAPSPSFVGIAGGTYAGFISNATAGGGWSLLGAAAVTVVSPIPPPEPEPEPDPCDPFCEIQ